MISVVCVYNDENALKNVLLKSLENQTAKFELVRINNLDHAYRSAAEALNYGARQAQGDYLMFVHQDMWLASDTWLEDAEKILTTLPCLGVAGVAGMSDKGRNWYERVKFSISVLESEERTESGRVKAPEEVQTLDECVLIVPRSVFERLHFDERVFDGWDCYGADYCLAAKQVALKVYVIPLPCSHCTSRASYPIWQFKDLLKYHERLYQKYRNKYQRIYTWMGTISWLNLRLRSITAFIGPLYLRLFPNIFVLMKRELSGCESVLDLGCGPHSPLQVCNIPFSVGVELFEPSLLDSRRIGIHSQYILGDIRKIAFRPKSFDAVIAVEVLEHLTKEEGIRLLHRMEEWAKRKVIVTTPNGYLTQDPYDNNPLQEHRSGWDVHDLRSLGLQVRGSAGWKALRGHKGYVKYRPAFLWKRIADVTQPLVYRFPNLSFQLMAIKQIGEGNSGYKEGQH